MNLAIDGKVWFSRKILPLFNEGELLLLHYVNILFILAYMVPN